MNVMVALVCVAFVTSKSGNEASRGRSLSVPPLESGISGAMTASIADVLFIGSLEQFAQQQFIDLAICQCLKGRFRPDNSQTSRSICLHQPVYFFAIRLGRLLL